MSELLKQPNREHLKEILEIKYIAKDFLWIRQTTVDYGVRMELFDGFYKQKLIKLQTPYSEGNIHLEEFLYMEQFELTLETFGKVINILEWSRWNFGAGIWRKK